MPLYELYTGWKQARAQRQRLMAAAAAAAASTQPTLQPPPPQRRAVITVPRPGHAKALPGTAAAAQLQAQAQAQRQQQLRPTDLFFAKLRVSVVRCTVVWRVLR